MAVGQLPDDDKWEVIDEDSGDDEFEIIEEPAPVQQPIQSPKPQLLGLDEPVKAEPTLWEKLDTPLTDLPSRVAKVGADKIDEPELDSSFPRLKGFAAGALQGAGDLFTRMTSPLELGMALASGGASIARRGGLRGLSMGLEAANLLGSATDAGLGAKEIIQADDNSGRLSGLARIGGAGSNAVAGLKGLKKLANQPPASAIPELQTTPIKTLAAEPIVESVESVEPPKLQLEKQPIIQPQDSVNIDSTVDDMFNEALTARASEPVVPNTKPKIKVKLNPETNTLEPDLNDPLTAKVVKSAKTGEPVPQRERIDPDTEIDLNDVLESKEPEWMPGGKPEKEHEASQLREVLGLTRALQSTIDLSFPLRQGRTLIHTKGWWKAWGDSINALGSEDAYKAVNESIANRPNFRGRVHRKSDGSIDYIEKSLAQEAGLYIGDLRNTREEALGSALAEKIPGIGRYVRGSNRAYNAFSNKLRADAFDDLIAKNPHAKTDLVAARAIANFVNNATGRGNLGKFEAAASHFNEMFFSPRLMKSRFHMMNPRNLFLSRPEVRNEYLKSMGLMASTWFTMAKLAEYGGAEVSWDPESSDFGKIKIGDTRIDPAAGFQQPLVLMYRLAKGIPQKLLYGEGRYADSPLRTAGSDVMNFLEGKLSPNARLVSELVSADRKRPFETGDQALKSIMPITVQGFSELAQEDPDLLPLIGLDALGIGVSTYKKGKKPSRLLPESIFPSESDLSFPLRR